MRTVAVVVSLALSACSSDLVLPDDVTPGAIAGASATDWWLGMPGPAASEFVLDARLTRYVDGAFTRFDTVDVCQGACRHIAYGGDGLLVLDDANEGVLLVDATGAVVEALPFPDDTVDAPWLLAGRSGRLFAASGTQVFERDGAAWRELPPLDAPAFSLAVQDDGVLVARRSLDDALEHAALIGDAWLAAEGTSEDALVRFDGDGTFVDDSALVVEGDQVVRLALLDAGLLAARVTGGALDVVVAASNATATWASLGSVQGSVSEASFRATVFEDGTVGVLYPGAPRDEGVGPKAVLRVDAAP